MIKTKDIKQGVMIRASAHDVYEALMDSKKHSKFTGEPAKISRNAGGKFSAYGKYISGENLELIKDEKIVQRWRASDWPEGHYSVVIFLLKPAPNGTKLMFNQKSIPAEQAKSIADGWKEFYWEPLKRMLEKDSVKRK